MELLEWLDENSGAMLAALTVVHVGGTLCIASTWGRSVKGQADTMLTGADAFFLSYYPRSTS